MRQLELFDFDEPPVWYPSRLPIDTGWTCLKAREGVQSWRHESGATLEIDCGMTSVNGAEPRMMAFWEALEMAVGQITHELFHALGLDHTPAGLEDSPTDCITAQQLQALAAIQPLASQTPTCDS